MFTGALITALSVSAAHCRTALDGDRSNDPSLPYFVSGDFHLKNANHVFNALQSSMRQWGSSYHRNGMSVFLATVPQGTQFYHGSSQAEVVIGMEWLAFEPEHALGFAHRILPPRQRPPPPSPSNTPVKAPSDHPDQRTESMTRSELHLAQQVPLFGGDQEASEHDHHSSSSRFHSGWPSRPPPPPPHPEHGYPQVSESESTAGYFHTYTAKHDLSLLYIDGQSAGKTMFGTLDMQDYLLLNRSTDDSPFNERGRARGLCDMARTRWNDKVQGFIRMEAGFEVILCNFSRDLDLVNIVQTMERERPRPLGKDGFRDRATYQDSQQEPYGSLHETLLPRPPRDGIGPAGGNIRWLRAIAARYDGIGGNRVQIDYSNFVTAYAYDLELFKTVDQSKRPDQRTFEFETGKPIKNPHGMKSKGINKDGRGQDGSTSTNQNNHTLLYPRLQHLVPSSLDTIRRDIDSLVLSLPLQRAISRPGDNTQTQKPSRSSRGMINWQAHADMLTTRYAHALLSFRDDTTNLSSPTSLSNIQDQIAQLYEPFIDFANRSVKDEISRCIAQVLSPELQSRFNVQSYGVSANSSPKADTTTPLAFRAIHTVTSRVCTTLHSILNSSITSSPASSSYSSSSSSSSSHSAPSPSSSSEEEEEEEEKEKEKEKEIRTKIVDLINWLDWSVFARCWNHPCHPWKEVCFIPIWPLGYPRGPDDGNDENWDEKPVGRCVGM